MFQVLNMDVVLALPASAKSPTWTFRLCLHRAFVTKKNVSKIFGQIFWSIFFHPGCYFGYPFDTLGVDTLLTDLASLLLILVRLSHAISQCQSDCNHIASNSFTCDEPGIEDDRFPFGNTSLRHCAQTAS